MRHLEFDVADSTPNPLYVPTTRTAEAEAEDAGASSSSRSDDHTHDTNCVREYLHYAARWLLLLVPPIVGIWGWDSDALVRPHMLSFTYAQIIYAGMVYVSMHRGGAHRAGKTILGVVVGVYVLTCVLGISLPDTKVTTPSGAGVAARCACGGCAYLAKTDLPPAMHYRGLFPHGQDGVMAIGGASGDGGKRLSLAAVTQLGGMYVLLSNTGQNGLIGTCDGIVGAALLGGFFGPCDASCTMKKPNTATCLQAMQHPTCQAIMVKERDHGRSLVALINPYMQIPILPNPADDAVIKDILRSRVHTIETMITRFTNGTAQRS